ncbi:threonine-phosphate decarboxylase CobD [Oceanobacillus senegalensis]|uniref:threonine-phosphate decarboxylase CobD n=1 Tax=Oceanobacillus senegalensis TaxID=1936063 RepID=UPI000A307D19|nr:threonine-phosphate decarboxylase CobD [Oceanobacillus senegalensis]
MNWPEHGSNPQYTFKKMGFPMPDNYIDFSANINPMGPPKKLKQQWGAFIEKIAEYPDPYAYTLKKKIAQKANVESSSILIGNGASEIIHMIGQMLAFKKVLIIEPSFSEYEKACRVNGCQIEYFYLKEPTWEIEWRDLINKLSVVDAVFLCNPNNPTGIQYSYSTTIRLLEECKKRDVLFIIDEAFYDFSTNYESITSLVKESNQIVLLRSLTKIYSIPGLRLGYLIAHPSIIEKLSPYQPQWSINSVAMQAGEVCLEEDSFIHKTVGFIKEERARLFSFFDREGFNVSASSVNFYLLQDPSKEALALFAYLLKRGLVPRHTYNFPGLDGKWLRFAIKSTEENSRLMEVLSEWKRLPCSPL